DAYKVQKRTMEILEKKIGGKKTAVWPRLGGGTLEEELEENRRGAQALSDEKILELVRLGRKVEDYYEKPQDIEWALEKNKLYVIQSRPVTTLYPVPVSVLGKEGLRVYASINHVQVMTEPFSPLGASVLRTMIPFGKGGDPEKESPYCVEAGGRLYTDVTEALRFKRIGRFLIGFAMRVDRLIAGALREIAGRREFQAFPGLEARRALSRAFFSFFLPVVFRIFLNFWVLEPERAEAGFRREIDRRLRRVQERLRSAPQGPGRVRLIQEVLSGLPSFFREAVPRVAAGILSWNLLEKFAGREEKDSADVAAVVRGLRGNVTTEMDLELGDLADVARRYPAAARCLEQAQAGDILDLLKGVEGGEVFAGAFREFLRKYGMRGQGEVDIGRPRWRENPAMLVQAMRGNLASPEIGLHRKRHERLAKEAEEAGARLIQKAKRDSWGFVKAWMARRLIRVCRCYLALREHPKFYIVRVFGFIREALLEEGCALQERGVLEDSRDVVYLTLNETAEALEGSAAVDFRRLVADRKNERKRWERLVPPRVITSDGEIVIPRREAKGFPEGSLAGTPASAGVAEGFARVIRDPSREILRHGEILVAPFSDPAWTPLFLHAAGFVAEVGGLMTHGAVVAREYGIPAVVGVVDAVKLIRTGQRIRVHGDLGYVETLDAPSSL
ncbi:MAG: phosphoenolpyruvate synthase, partial [Candidatus Omnitrophica bacterium]|nr:phosphoenolpyruvate synthase [Candidatus Omnitrophota bacterium]